MNNARIARNAQHGFTLIELLITVAIIAILAVIGATAYASFGAKAQASEAFNQVEGVKHAYMIKYNEDGKVQGNYELSDLFGLSANRLDWGGRYVEYVNVTNGQIVVSFGANADAPLAGTLLTMVAHETPAGALIWRCGDAAVPSDGTTDYPLAGFAGGSPAVAGTANSTPVDLLPKNCRP
jgi:type IV pilus assembly protein PilA